MSGPEEIVFGSVQVVRGKRIMWVGKRCCVGRHYFQVLGVEETNLTLFNIVRFVTKDYPCLRQKICSSLRTSKWFN